MSVSEKKIEIFLQIVFVVVTALDVPNVTSNLTAKLSLGQQAQAPVNELLEAMMWLGRLAVVVEQLMQFSDKVSINVKCEELYLFRLNDQSLFVFRVQITLPPMAWHDDEQIDDDEMHPADASVGMKAHVPAPCFLHWVFISFHFIYSLHL